MKRLTGIMGMASIAVLVLIGAATGPHTGKRTTVTHPITQGVITHQTEIGRGEMRDSCISASPFEVTNHGPMAC